MKPFDIAQHLHNEQDYQAFLQEVIETGDASDFLHALGIVARAKGMNEATQEMQTA